MRPPRRSPRLQRVALVLICLFAAWQGTRQALALVGGGALPPGDAILAGVDLAVDFGIVVLSALLLG